MTVRRFAALGALSLVGLVALPSSAGAAPPPPPPDPTCTPGPADCSEWHRAAVVTVTWAQAPPGVNVEGCETKTITTDTAAQPVSCIWWNADGSKMNSVNVRRDATPPTVSARGSRAPDANGWYNSTLAVEFTGGDSLSGLASCSGPRQYGGPDASAVTVSGTCADVAGNVATASFTFQYDATPPSATARPDRQPDHQGWYNRKVTVEFQGSDATSGVASCTPAVTYAGPDSGKTAVSGTCTDRAANTSSAAAFELRFDTRPPALARLKAEARKKDVALRWAASGDATTFTVIRRPGLDGAKWSAIYSGPKKSFVDGRVAEGVRYRYTVTASDDAGNDAVKGVRVRAPSDTSARSSVRAKTTPALRRPLEGARLAAPPLLAWSPVPKATYYNVQLFRNGKKVLSAWPADESFRLQRSWKFDGRTQRLSPGRYRWYVWPGFGLRAANRYGKLLGTRTFVVTSG